MTQQHYAIVATTTLPITQNTHRLLEIYIIRRTGDRVVGTFTSLVNPRRIIPEGLTEEIKITQAAVRFEPVFCEIAEPILDLLDGAIIVSNRADFDYRVLRSEFKTIGYTFKSPIICTSKLAETTFSTLGKLDLGSVGDLSAMDNAHALSAKERARVSEKLFTKLVCEESFVDGSRTLVQPLDVVQHKSELLNLQALERKPGVYYFKDAQDSILYIGKAVRIRDRVRSHFNNKTDRERNLCAITSKIDHVNTGSNLIAELLEADEIKKHQPEFNIAQKKKTTPFIIVSSENKNGYIQLSIIRKDYTDSVNEVFYNRKSVAEKLMEVCGLFNLCPKFTGIHRSSGKCNHDVLSNCLGACVEEEPVDTYNLRVRKALNFLKDDTKNFAIRLQGRTNCEMGFVLVRNGIYLGYGFIESNDQIVSLDDFENYLIPKTHSYHTVRIIDTYIRKPLNRSKIISFDSVVRIL